MKPPHWLCLSCGFIITDSGSEPRDCVRCSGKSWHYLGYEGEYDPEEAREKYLNNQNVDKKLKNLN
ncbi:MAG: hypothetical protein GF383_07265 [Candidatus Lokiarchaeota archaeon]|nr:hypothetical protein [Candidatus Lokiarchaeota archaeon]MBD3339967.1 hypothetical protein [Candidatus Lokiarchaeota archaeon]